MRKALKYCFYFLLLLFFFKSPVYAGTVKLQTEYPLYTVKDGQELTEEEQCALENVIDYFTENPSAATMTITKDQFPSLSLNWFNAILEKLDVITEHYPIPENNGGFYTSSLIYPTNETDSSITIVNNHFTEALAVKLWVDYTYSLVPECGIYTGMDELEAVDIINDFVCDTLSYDMNYQCHYLDLYQTHKGVCMDYAILFKALAEGAGIESYEVASYSEYHMWNSVVIDNQTYEIDTCYNDVYSRHYIYMLSRNTTSKYVGHMNIECER